MAKKKDNETFDGQDISAIMNGDVFSSFLQVVNSTRNLLLTATPSPSYDTVSPENFATNDVEYVGFAKDGRNLVVTYYYDNDSLNTPSQSSVTIKDYFDNAEETMTVSKVKVSDFARKAFVNIADIAQSVSPEGDDWADITQYLNGQEYSGQINYNETTGKLELTKFELSEGSVDNMTKSGEEYLAEGNNAIPLSLTPENYNSSVKINGTTYYFDTDDQRLQTLTRIGSSALVETTNSEDAVFSYGGKYYTYNPDKLPISACEYEEVTNETDILNGNYNSVRYKDGVIHYYDIVLNPSRMTSSSSVLWTETTKSEAIDDVTGKLKAGYLEIKMHKVNGTDDSRYMKYSLKSLSIPTSENNQDVITSADKVTFPNTKLSDLVIGKPEGTNDLVMYYNGTEERIKLTDWFTTAAADRIQKIVDSTGTEYDIVHDTAYNKTIKYLTEEDDEYTVSTGNIIVMALNGDDTLTVNSNYNSIYGGNGADTITINSHSNIIYGDDGNDNITLSIGAPNTYIFRTGDGNDSIYVPNHQQASNGTLKFTDVKFEDIKFNVDPLNPNDLIISYTNEDSVRLLNSCGFVTYYLGKNLVDCTGTKYNTLKDAHIYLNGTNDNDYLSFHFSNTTINGFAGNDQINLGVGATKNIVYAGEGNDSIILGISATYNSIYGGTGNDTITMSLRNIENNTVFFARGDGNDTVVTNSSSWTATNKLQFTDVKFEDMVICVDPTNQANLKIQYTNNDSVILSGWFNYTTGNRIDKIIDMTGTEYSIVNDAPDYNKLFLTNGNDTFTLSVHGKKVYALDGNDTITVNSSNNTIYGGKGNDTIGVNSPHNSNNFIFSSGDGNDRISAVGNTVHATHKLTFTDVKFKDMVICVDPANQTDLKIQYTDTDSVSLAGWYSAGTGNRIDKIIDMTGTEYSIVNDAPDYNKLFLTNGNDTFTLSVHGKKVYALDGNDTITVNSSNNTIYGGKGNDTIGVNSPHNSNNFIFSSGDGNDRISAVGNTVHATHKLTFTDVKFEDMVICVDPANQTDLKIQYTDTDSVSLAGWYSAGTGNRIDKIIDMTGTEYSIVNDAPDYNKLFLTNGNDTFTLSVHGKKVYALDGNDTININSSNNTIYGGKGNDTIGVSPPHNSNNFIFSSGDGNDRISAVGNTVHATHKLTFTDVKFEDMVICVDPTNQANLKIQYTDNDSVFLTGWFNYTTGNRIDKIIDTTGAMGIIGKSGSDVGVGVGNNSFSTTLASKLAVYDPFTTDNDTLTISDTNASGLHVAGNFKADGTLDGNGLRVLSDDNYTAWKSDTTSINGGVQIVSELGSVENITSADSKTVTASELAQLQSDVTAWFTNHSAYADVSEAIANAGSDSSVATLIAIFDNFNTTAWNS